VSIPTVPHPAAEFVDARFAPVAGLRDRRGSEGRSIVSWTVVITDGAAAVYVGAAPGGIAVVGADSARFGPPLRALGDPSAVPTAAEIAARERAADVAAIEAEDTLTQAAEASGLDCVG
jgi:hypothetical protein